MTLTELRLKLKRANLSELSRLSQVPLRTLRRIKNGKGEALAGTIERIEPHLRQARNPYTGRFRREAA